MRQGDDEYRQCHGTQYHYHQEGNKTDDDCRRLRRIVGIRRVEKVSLAG